MFNIPICELSKKIDDFQTNLHINEKREKKNHHKILLIKLF